MGSFAFYLPRAFKENELSFVIEPYLKNYWELDSLQQRFLTQSSVSRTLNLSNLIAISSKFVKSNMSTNCFYNTVLKIIYHVSYRYVKYISLYNFSIVSLHH